MLYTKVLCAGVFLVFCSLQTNAYGYDALEACRNQTKVTSEINDCLDNYLDLMDQNLGDLTVFIDGELRGGARAAFNRAQNSFYSYRRENCLWYLELGNVRVEAEQVAKNCLAEMSQKRLAELQQLIANYPVEGAGGLAAQALIDLELEAGDENIEVSSDVQEPATIAENESDNQALSESAEDDVSNTALSAFLGQWQVVCDTLGSAKQCTLDVPLESLDGKNDDAVMRVTRRGGSSIVELQFPNLAIASPEQVLWRIDAWSIGAISGSTISENAAVARQVISESKILQDDLLPLFRTGNEVGITLLTNAGESTGDEFQSTLLGFSRALAFADDFISGELQQ